jgi:RecB family exonuclease
MTQTVIEPPRLEHLSYSSLNQYRTCPKQFFFRKIANAPEERRSSSLVFGGAIHRSAERLHEARLEGRKLPSIKSLVAEYDKAWGEEISSGPEVVYPKADSAGSLRATASKMLAVYREHAAKQRGEIIAIEHEAVVPVAANAVPLKARIDLVMVEEENLVVEDLKTSKSRYSPAKVAESLPQLIVYSAAVSRMVGELGLKRVRPRFTVLTKAVTPIVQTIEPEASQADVVRLRELVVETSDAIAKGVFPRREGWQCAHCPFRQRCLGKGASE